MIEIFKGTVLPGLPVHPTGHRYRVIKGARKEKKKKKTHTPPHTRRRRRFTQPGSATVSAAILQRPIDVGPCICPLTGVPA